MLRRAEFIAVNETPSHSYGMSLAIWDHTVLPAAWHEWTHLVLTPARGRNSIYLPRMDERPSVEKLMLLVKWSFKVHAFLDLW